MVHCVKFNESLGLSRGGSKDKEGHERRSGWRRKYEAIDGNSRRRCGLLHHQAERNRAGERGQGKEEGKNHAGEGRGYACYGDRRNSSCLIKAWRWGGRNRNLAKKGLRASRAHQISTKIKTGAWTGGQAAIGPTENYPPT